MKGPTDRQLEYLRFLWDYHEAQGYWPSFKEFGERFAREGCAGSSQNAACAFRSLVRKGLLVREPMKSRAMRFTEEGLRAIGK